MTRFEDWSRDYLAGDEGQQYTGPPPPDDYEEPDHTGFGDTAAGGWDGPEDDDAVDGTYVYC